MGGILWASKGVWGELFGVAEAMLCLAGKGWMVKEIECP